MVETLVTWSKNQNGLVISICFLGSSASLETKYARFSSHSLAQHRLPPTVQYFLFRLMHTKWNEFHNELLWLNQTRTTVLFGKKFTRNFIRNWFYFSYIRIHILNWPRLETANKFVFFNGTGNKMRPFLVTLSKCTKKKKPSC